jgi:hypothetical protein
MILSLRVVLAPAKLKVQHLSLLLILASSLVKYA